MNEDLPPKARAAVAAPPKPLPRPQDPVEQEFFDRCQDGHLHFQKCQSCGSWRHLPRYLCARCGSPDFSWAQSSGTGTVFSSPVVNPALHPPFAAAIPSITAMAEPHAGGRMAPRLSECIIA